MIQELKHFLRDYLESIGHHVGKKNKLHCPIHNDNNPSCDYDPIEERIHCWSCDFRGDIFDVVEKRENIDRKSAFLRVNEMYGGGKFHKKSLDKKVNKNLIKQQNNEDISAKRENYIKKCQNNIHLTDYHLKRGFSDEFARKVGLGYDVESNALLIPIDNGFFIRRNCDPNAKIRYDNEKGVEIGLFNSSALNHDEYVIVVEGAIDALSIQTSVEGIENAPAVLALNSTGNAKKLVELIASKISDGWTQKYPLILSLDGDNAGHSANIELQDELKKLDVTSIICELDAGEDFNALLTKYGKEGVGIEVFEFKRKAEEYTNEIKKEEEKIKIEYALTSNANIASHFLESLLDRPKPIPTFFSDFDRILSGGLVPGLHILGAPPSVGKTSLCVQMADNIASQGVDVLFFSLEVSAFEIQAKILSRYASTHEYPCTALDITSGKVMERGYYRQEEYTKAVLDYTSSIAAQHTFVVDFDEPPTIDAIKERVQNHIKMRNSTPVIFIDYLQLIASKDIRLDIRIAIKQISAGLASISKEYKTPIVVISSLNRSSYKVRGAFESFKESGEIEYSANILMVLQFCKSGEKDFNFEEEQKKHPRRLELSVIKNRYGGLGTARLDFFPRQNLFEASIFDDLPGIPQTNPTLYNVGEKCISK